MKGRYYKTTNLSKQVPLTFSKTLEYSHLIIQQKIIDWRTGVSRKVFSRVTSFISTKVDDDKDISSFLQ